MTISSYLKETEVTISGNNTISVREYKDLAPIQDYLKEEKNINSARIYWGNMRKSVHDIPTSLTSKRVVDMNGDWLSVRDFAYAGGAINNYIVTDDIEALGINLIEGHTPQSFGEIAIPKSKQLYFNAVGGYYDDITHQEVRIEPEELLGYDFYGVKIVGIYDDGVSVPEKYAKYNVSTDDYDSTARKIQEEAESYVKDKILANSVILPPIYADIWDSAWYMTGPTIARNVQGQYIHTSMTANGMVHDNIGVAPANEYTKHITGIDSVPRGSVLVSRTAAMEYGIENGDEINLYTSLVRGEVMAMGPGYVEDAALKSNDYTVIVDESIKPVNWEILYNAADYDEMMKGAKVGLMSLYIVWTV